ncbi:hypothetical protein [Microbulbifer elongatus]|uniref:hypothetical protein n=1 Tax=Microbulbifer elongatus TaxID=86173 RepID=UPI001E41651A|nr:hypothetical protein [Microbulbifer elongatus]
MPLKLCSEQGDFYRTGLGHRWWPFLFLGLVNVPLQSVALPSPEVSLDFYSRTVSEALPINEFTGKWQQAPGGGENTWTRNRLDTGVWLGDWGVSYTVRYDYQLKYNQATADLYYRDEQGLNPPQDAVPVYLNALQLLADGIRLKRRWSLDSGLFLQANVSLLKAREFQDGTIDGLLSSDEQFFAGNASLDYRYSEDLLLEHEFEKPEGEGLTVDLVAGYQNNQRKVIVRVEDAYSLIRWEQAPYTHGKFDTADRDVEDEVQLAPVFSGWRELEDHEFTLPVYATGRYVEQMDGYQLSLDMEYFADQVRYRPGIRWGNLPGNPYVGVDGAEGQWVFTLSDDSEQLRLQLGFDDPNLEKAHSLTMALVWSTPM